MTAEEFSDERTTALRQLLLDTIADEPRRRRRFQLALTSILAAVAVVLAGGTAALAMTGVELGLYVSFSGILTFKTSENLRRIARMVPGERLLVETDAPYLAPVPFRGKRNEPSYVVETAKVLADAIGLSFDEAARMTTENARRCYWKMDHAAPVAQVA